jgi:hypothetical protein
MCVFNTLIPLGYHERTPAREDTSPALYWCG